MQVSIVIERQKKRKAIQLLKKHKLLPADYSELDDFDALCDNCYCGIILTTPIKKCPECKRRDERYEQMQRCPKCAIKTNMCMRCGHSIG